MNHYKNNIIIKMILLIHIFVFRTPDFMFINVYLTQTKIVINSQINTEIKIKTLTIVGGI